MNEFIALLKINLNLNFSISALKYRYTKEGKSKWEPILIGIGILAGAGPLIALYTLLCFGILTGGKMLGQPEMLLTVTFVFTQLIILFLGIFYVMGAFYFSNDLNILLPLPLKPYQVLGSKFAVVLVNEYITALPLLLPPIIVYGAGTGQNIFYWIKGLFLLITAPAIPLLAGSLFVILLMRLVNIRKRKDLLAIIGGFIGILVALSTNFLFSRIPEGNETEYFNNLLTSNAGFVDMIGKRFPPSLWATYGLSKPGTEGLLYFLLFIGVSVVLLAALMIIGNRFFYKSLLSGQEISRKRKSISAAEMNKRYSKASSPVLAVYAREWKILLREPVYVLNGLAGSIIGPFLIVFMFVMQKSSEEGRKLYEFLSQPGAQLPVTLAGLGLMLFTSGMNIVASTSVSREGRTFWIARLIPVPARDQVLGKFLNAYAVSALGIIVTAVVLAAFIGMALHRILIITIIALIASVFQNAASLILDIIHPKMNWKSPQEAMKQNMNGLFGMLVTMVYGGILAIPAVIMTAAGLPEWAVYLVLAFLSAGSSLPALYGMLSLAERQYAKLEA